MDLFLIFKALSNKNRLKAFEIIRNGHTNVVQCRNENRSDGIPEDAVCVCEILDQLNVSAPTLSHHLKELRFAGIVNLYHCGQWSYYTVCEDVLELLSDYFSKSDKNVLVTS